MRTSNTQSNFDNKYSAKIVCFSVSVVAVVVFLSVAFFWFDATNLPSSNSSSNEDPLPYLKTDQLVASQDLIATAYSLLKNTHIEFSPSVFSSFVSANLNATISPDNSMWRYTPDGWKDISMVSNQAQSPKPLIERVHPAIWTAILLLSSLLLLIMASNDKEVRRLLSALKNRKKN